MPEREGAQAEYTGRDPEHSPDDFAVVDQSSRPGGRQKGDWVTIILAC